MTFAQFVTKLDDFAWSPFMLVLLVGTGIYLSTRVGFIQFGKFGYIMKNTLGKMFKPHDAKEGEVTPLQAVTTALAGTVGTGNITGVTGAIAVGGPGAVFWMLISALFGMVTKYAEVVLSIRYREKNEKGDWVGGPMYYIRNGLGKSWNWLAVLFCLLGGLCAFGIGNVSQVNSIASALTTTMEALGGNPGAHTVVLFGNTVTVASIVIGAIVAVAVGLVLLGGIKGIGRVTEKLVPVMAVIYIVSALVTIGVNGKYLGPSIAMIFKGAFNAEAALGGAFGITIIATIKNGVARGVFSNEAGLGSAPMAHAASSEKNPVKQGFYGTFEVFMDTIVICTLTSLALLCGTQGGAGIVWGEAAGAPLVITAFSSALGSKFGAIAISVGLTLFAFSTVLSWGLYGARCAEYLLGTKAVKFYQFIFILVVIIGPMLSLDVVWTLADAMNGLMALPNLVALIGLSGVVIKLTKEYFEKENAGKLDGAGK